MYYLKNYTFHILFCTFVFACAHSGDNSKQNHKKAPDWIFKTPKPAGKLCAIGISGPAYSMNKAKELAAEQARFEIAKAIKTEVVVVGIDKQNMRGSTVSQQGISNTTAWASEAAMSATIVSYWVDETGVHSVGKKNTTYALACMDKR